MVPIGIIFYKSNYSAPGPNSQMIQTIVIIWYRSDYLDYSDMWYQSKDSDNSDNIVPVKRFGQ